MEPPANPIHIGKKQFQLFEHPWLSLLAVILTMVLAIFIAAIVIFEWIGLSDYSTRV